MIEVFCPLLKDTCREKECVMFRNEKCVISSFLEGYQKDKQSAEADEISFENVTKEYAKIADSEERETPGWLKDRDYEDIGKEIMEFAKKEYPQGEIDPDLLCNLFWTTKGIEKYNVPASIRTKMRKAESIIKTEYVRWEIEQNKRMNKIRISEIEEAAGKEDEKEVPDWILKENPQEISIRMLEFLKNDFPNTSDFENYGFLHYDRIMRLFWKDNGINEFSMSKELQTKMAKAESLFEKEQIRAEMSKKEEAKKEKEEIKENQQLQNPKKSLLIETAEDLANAMVKFMESNNPENPNRNFYDVSQLFWENKSGYNRDYSIEDKVKIQKAEDLVCEELTTKRQEKEKQRLESEKAKLPSLVTQCVEWARAKGAKKIIWCDIEAFLREKDLQLLSITQRDLYRMVKSKA